MSKKELRNEYVFIFFLLVFQAIRIFGEEFEKPAFILTNIVFTLYVTMKIYSLRKVEKALLNPLLLGSIKMFLLAYGSTIFYVYLENRPLYEFIPVHHPYGYLNNGMIYASLGFLSMWHSYQSEIVKRLSNQFIKFITRKKQLLRFELEPRWLIIYGIFFFSIVFKLILISLGVYGVINTILSKNVDLPYMQYIITLSSAGSGSLLFLYLYYFKTGKKRNQFIIFFLIDLFFSILT